MPTVVESDICGVRESALGDGGHHGRSAYPTAYHRTYNFGIWLCEGSGEERECERMGALTDCSFRLRDVGKLNDTHSLGAGALKQNLGKLNLAGGLEELDKIFVSG